MSTVEPTKDRLLAAASEIFAEKGYEAATVREISQLAEVNLASINYHFGDKERLYIESVKRALTSRAEQVPIPKWDASTPAGDKLKAFITTMVLRMVGEPDPSWHVKLMMREMMRPSAACAELVQDYIRPHFEMLQGILSELLPAEVSAADRHLIAFSIIGQCLYFRVARPVIPLLVGAEEYATFTPARLGEHIARFTLSALGLTADGLQLDPLAQEAAR